MLKHKNNISCDIWNDLVIEKQNEIDELESDLYNINQIIIDEYLETVKMHDNEALNSFRYGHFNHYSDFVTSFIDTNNYFLKNKLIIAVNIKNPSLNALTFFFPPIRFLSMLGREIYFKS